MTAPTPVGRPRDPGGYVWGPLPSSLEPVWKFKFFIAEAGVGVLVVVVMVALAVMMRGPL